MTFDEMHVALSKMLGDPVAAAATNGVVWTSALRDVLLNTAHRRWHKKQIIARNFNALRKYKDREGQALTNNELALSAWTGGVALILSARNSTDGVWVRRLPDEYVALARSGENSYYTPSTTNQFFVIEDEGFVLMDGASNTGDTIELEYVKPHTNLVAGATFTVVSDTAWSATATAVTNFTGVLASHVGGTFVGLDNGGNAFSRKISGYVSATAFTINSALVANGAGTNGYIIPPASSDTLAPATYHDEILDLAYKVGAEERRREGDLQIATVKEQIVNAEIAAERVLGSM